MAEAQKTVFIDEKTGKDDGSATGEESSPYQSLPFAYVQTDGTANYQVRKYEEDKEPEWTAPSKAGMKKAVGALALHKKKAAKEQELAIRQQKEQEARDKVLEEAKKIVITMDESLPEARKIQLDYQGDDLKLHKEGSEEKGTRVRVLGMLCWVNDSGMANTSNSTRTTYQETEGEHVRCAQRRLRQDAVRLHRSAGENIRCPYIAARDVYGGVWRALRGAGWRISTTQP